MKFYTIIYDGYNVVIDGIFLEFDSLEDALKIRDHYNEWIKND